MSMMSPDEFNLHSAQQRSGLCTLCIVPMYSCCRVCMCSFFQFFFVCVVAVAAVAVAAVAEAAVAEAAVAEAAVTVADVVMASVAQATVAVAAVAIAAVAVADDSWIFLRRRRGQGRRCH